MELSKKVLDKLREKINEETEYRKGHEIVEFFNQLGFNDSYGQNFGTRSVFTDEKLARLNGTADMDRCIKLVFSPVNFVGRIEELDNHIKDFNQYLMFHDWKLVRNGKNILFKKSTEDEWNEKNDTVIINDKEVFLAKEFNDIPIGKLKLDSSVEKIISDRIVEIENCMNSNSSLAAIFLSGSTLEGILLGVASKNPREFNTARSTPKDKEGKVKQFHQWNLSNYIDVAYENQVLREDVKKFSHVLRDFRNYIHPYQQLSSGFYPDKDTMAICFQVLKAAINQISEYENR